MTEQVSPLLMSCLGKILAGVASRYFPRGLGFGVRFSYDAYVFVLQAWYQHPMPYQQHQRTEGNVILFLFCNKLGGQFAVLCVFMLDLVCYIDMVLALVLRRRSISMLTLKLHGIV